MSIVMPDYRDKEGRYRTQSLFKEMFGGSSKYEPVFTLKPKDDGKLISMKRLYMEIGDITEYEFAMTVLGSWEHWNKLCECSWFSPYIDKWRVELETKLRSEAIKSMVSLSKGDKGIQAAKWLAEAGWKPKARGRPSKEQVRREARIQAGLDQSLDSHLDRMGIDVETKTH